MPTNISSNELENNLPTLPLWRGKEGAVIVIAVHCAIETVALAVAAGMFEHYRAADNNENGMYSGCLTIVMCSAVAQMLLCVYFLTNKVLKA